MATYLGERPVRRPGAILMMTKEQFREMLDRLEATLNGAKAIALELHPCCVMMDCEPDRHGLDECVLAGIEISLDVAKMYREMLDDAAWWADYELAI